MVPNKLAPALAAPLLAALALCVAPAAAQDAAAQDAVAPRLALAREMVQVSGAADNFERSVPGIVQSLSGAFLQQVPVQARPLLQQTVVRAMIKLKPQFLEATAQAYANTFSERELADILAFYRTPAGQALAAKGPELARQSAAGLAALMPQIRTEIANQLCAQITCTPQMRDALRGGTGT